eukprot:Rmarinus@m.7325
MPHDPVDNVHMRRFLALRECLREMQLGAWMLKWSEGSLQLHWFELDPTMQFITWSTPSYDIVDGIPISEIYELTPCKTMETYSDNDNEGSQRSVSESSWTSSARLGGRDGPIKLPSFYIVTSNADVIPVIAPSWTEYESWMAGLHFLVTTHDFASAGGILDDEDTESEVGSRASVSTANRPPPPEYFQFLEQHARFSEVPQKRISSQDQQRARERQPQQQSHSSQRSHAQVGSVFRNARDNAAPSPPPRPVCEEASTSDVPGLATPRKGPASQTRKSTRQSASFEQTKPLARAQVPPTNGRPRASSFGQVSAPECDDGSDYYDYYDYESYGGYDDCYGYSYDDGVPYDEVGPEEIDAVYDGYGYYNGYELVDEDGYPVEYDDYDGSEYYDDYYYVDEYGNVYEYVDEPDEHGFYPEDYYAAGYAPEYAYLPSAQPAYPHPSDPGVYYASSPPRNYRHPSLAEPQRGVNTGRPRSRRGSATPSVASSVASSASSASRLRRLARAPQGARRTPASDGYFPWEKRTGAASRVAQQPSAARQRPSTAVQQPGPASARPAVRRAVIDPPAQSPQQHLQQPPPPRRAWMDWGQEEPPRSARRPELRRRDSVASSVSSAPSEGRRLVRRDSLSSASALEGWDEADSFSEVLRRAQNFDEFFSENDNDSEWTGAASSVSSWKPRAHPGAAARPQSYRFGGPHLPAQVSIQQRPEEVSTRRPPPHPQSQARKVISAPVRPPVYQRPSRPPVYDDAYSVTSSAPSGRANVNARPLRGAHVHHRAKPAGGKQHAPWTVRGGGNPGGYHRYEGSWAYDEAASVSGRDDTSSDISHELTHYRTRESEEHLRARAQMQKRRPSRQAV